MKLLALGCALAALAAAPAARADVFWANKYDNAIGHSDGGAPNQSFITGASHPVGLAVDASHIYWTNYESPESIGRANLDGTGTPEQDFITGASKPVGIAVDGVHVYWTNAATGTIGRADLDGDPATQTFMTDLGRPYGLAVNAAHIYWTDIATGRIGCADLDGGHPNKAFITGASEPDALAIDGGHIYWSDGVMNKIGRAALDGGSVDHGFIDAATDPWGVAVDATHVYWTEQEPPKAVGRADLDGTDPNDNFMPASATGVYGVAVTPPATKGSQGRCFRSAAIQRPGSSPPPAVVDRSAPGLSAVGLSRSAFAAASRGPSIARVRAGTQLHYRLSEHATVRFAIKRRKAGRLVRRKCRKRTRRNRHRRKCDLALRGGFSHRGAAGRNRLRFSGRLRGRKLKPGRYVLIATATDAAGNRSKPARVRFRIRPR